MAIQPTLERYPINMLGREFQFVGEFEPLGVIVDYLNDRDRSTFPLYDVQFFRTAAGSPLSGISAQQLTIDRSEVGLIHLVDPEHQAKIQVIKNFEQVIVHTPHVVCRGKFHMGAETRLRDLFDLMTGSFLAMTDVSIYPLRELPTAFPQQADLLLLNRYYVTAYHPEPEG